MLTHQTFTYQENFKLESGAKLPGFQLQFSLWGTLNEDASNVIWVCHAFTGSSDFSQWWDGLFGKGKLYSPDKYLIICVNTLGGCYGSTGPLSVNPLSGKPYFHSFPFVTVRDVVRSFDLLRQHLGIKQIHTLIGGSLGGQQAVEWAIEQADVFQHLVLIAANAQHSPWGIAFNESQRQAIDVDPTWSQEQPDAGLEGMKVARSLALLSYRNYSTYRITQSEAGPDLLDGFRAASYQKYQGEKLAQRFNAFSYWTLSKMMDSHNVGRNRGGIASALAAIKAHTLVIGIDSDLLFPLREQALLHKYIQGSRLDVIHSDYGHDGFLIEHQQITQSVNTFYKQKSIKKSIGIMSTKIKIGLFGYGVVGQGLHDILQTHPNFHSEIVKIGVKDQHKKRNLPAHFFTYDKYEILNDPEINLIVEVISDANEAYTIIKTALINGKNVVTANKKVLAEHLEEFIALQTETGSALLYEASSCGSIPVIRNLEEYFDNEPIQSISGIFNGSSNYILTKIFEEGSSYASALAQAQALGFAEADPRLDVGGFDSTNKLSILIAHAFGTLIKPEEIFNAGIQHVSDYDLAHARGLNKKIKLVAHASLNHQGAIIPLVAPALVSDSHELSQVHNEFNAVLIDAKFSGNQLLKGKGAGGHPTGSAVLSDISANYYQYKYEYKKRQWAQIPVYRKEVELRIYFRFSAESQLIKLGIYDIIERGESHVIGKVNLSDLLANKALFEEEAVFIAIDFQKISAEQGHEERLFAQV